MTKKQILSDLNKILASGNRDCRATGETIENLVRRLQFWKAGPYTQRGLSDAGLPDAVFTQMLAFRLPFGFSGEACSYLDM